MRPGEKLYEELYLNYETIDRTPHEKIFVSQNEHREVLTNFEDKLKKVIEITEKGQDEKALRETVFGLVRADEKQVTKEQINIDSSA
jgi:FlaA1/EpsC-like NDP-sugar epimerase